ncbi:MAG TPA: hypothetical protein VME18_00765 [Acidobacteriaceae bacterium]|nr:hypothetical protein [Acidobacteriaceae bacterium]
MTMLLQETGTRFAAADRVWIAAALLQRENPARTDFTEAEILERGRREGLVEENSSVFAVHVNQHCVANRHPNPGKHRMLLETARGRRRLYREGDPRRPGRTGKIVPNPHEIPMKYRSLLDWYAKWSRASAPPAAKNEAADPLLLLRGTGRAIWKREHADEFVRNLREGWG